MIRINLLPHREEKRKARRQQFYCRRHRNNIQSDEDGAGKLNQLFDLDLPDSSA